MFTLDRIMEVGCSMLNLLKGAELKLAQQNMLRQKKKKLFWLEAIFLCQNLRRCFMGGGSYFMGESQNFEYISCPITS